MTEKSRKACWIIDQYCLLNECMAWDEKTGTCKIIRNLEKIANALDYLVFKKEVEATWMSL